MNLENIKKEDQEIFDAIVLEGKRQEQKLEMIASENFTSKAVMEACGSLLTNKYAEGYPDHRYYGGCEYVDVAEKLAIERGKKLFNAEHANVQSHSGSSANLSAYFALIEHGDTVLGMDLYNGGHLTHGSKVNMSGKYYNFIPYAVNDHTETIDFDVIRSLAKTHKPKLIVAGGSAYPRTIDAKLFREIADEVGALLLVDMAHFAGLAATGYHPNPVPYAHVVTTTTHKTLRGPRGGAIFCKAEFAKQIDKAIFPGTQGGPLMHVIAGKAVCFKEALESDFKNYQKHVVKNAKRLAEDLMDKGFRLVSNGTDNHLILLNLVDKGITGKDAEKVLDDIGITTNKNTVPKDPQGPFVTSGVRLGTPALTTRGLIEDDISEIAEAIAIVLNNPTSETQKNKAALIVKNLCEKYPLNN